MSESAPPADPAATAPAAGTEGKPSVLIIGGLGYVGRFLANYIHSNQLASTLRLVDKQLPQLASLAPEHQDACSMENFMQADAAREQSQSRIFDLPPGPDGTKRRRSLQSTKLSVERCGGQRGCEKRSQGIHRGQHGKCQMEARGGRRTLQDVRPETMRAQIPAYLRSLRRRVDRSKDEYSTQWRSQNDQIPNAPNDKIIFNVVDKGQTTQGTMANIIKQIFGIETGFQNTLVNTFARLNLEHVVDDLNDDTLDDWADLQEASGIKDNGGPLSPFMEKELLRDADLSLDGSRFETVLGFRPQHECINKEEVEGVIASYKRMNCCESRKCDTPSIYKQLFEHVSPSDLSYPPSPHVCREQAFMLPSATGRPQEATWISETFPSLSIALKRTVTLMRTATRHSKDQSNIASLERMERNSYT
ncbi:NAD(P)-binding protein [Hortaea werneckii]|nr:NAD(P)-binding protein [Hortaea werneckii]